MRGERSMALIKMPYELSLWTEKLNELGIKEEKKGAIIGAHDMDWAGAAKKVSLICKLNGTHELSFEMVDRYFDSAIGDYVDNEIIDSIYNETKIKLFYRNEWLEFYVKNISETKSFKSYIKKFTCTDAFIDELSRNGYGISFNTDLANNVEEIGSFTNTILKNSAWTYVPQYNWGDFTEYLEDKMVKIPVNLFDSLEGYKVYFDIPFTVDNVEMIENIHTGEKRPVELSDDYAAYGNGNKRRGFFWDKKVENEDDIANPLFRYKVLKNDEIANDGFIYIPYSQLQFCYKTLRKGIKATEEVQYYKYNNINSYAVTPKTTDPTALIQFIAIPNGANVEIDESGLIVSKDYTYIMTIKQWNDNIKKKYFYKFLPKTKDKDFIEINNGETVDNNLLADGNYAIGYDGYLDEIGDIDITHGKKISITDRTEINVTDDIDQFVKVYNNPNSGEYDDLLANTVDNDEWYGSKNGYRVCSKIETRMITPALARNLFQNGIGIKSTNGWEAQSIYIPEITTESTVSPQPISLIVKYLPPEQKTYIETQEETSVDKDFGAIILDSTNLANISDKKYHTVINFGMTGSEEDLQSDQIYCFGISFAKYRETTKEDKDNLQVKYKIDTDEKIILSQLNNISFICGCGGAESNGNYEINDSIELSFGNLFQSSTIENFYKDNYLTFYVLFKTNKTIKNPYLAICNTSDIPIIGIKSCELFKAYTKGQDFFDDGVYKYSGRKLFENELSNIAEGYKYSNHYTKEDLSGKILFEDDIMAGEAYEYNRYFIQQSVGETINDEGETIKKSDDTFGKKVLMGIDETAIFDSSIYKEEDCKINTCFFDMCKCRYYQENNVYDCNYSGDQKICLYQKYGYCPYRFQTEKHCRKVRTLNGEKSNRFNLTQELGKVFETYPVYHINHLSNGKTELDSEGKMKKEIYYIKEKGTENKIGFRYEKNLSSIGRTIKSDAIVTKLYVQDVDSSLSKTGLCSIKTAEDNISKDSFIIDLDYYVTKGLIDKDMLSADLYGINNDMGYLQKLGHLNSQYDELSNAIINLSTESNTKLEANLEVNLNGIDSAKKSLHKIEKQMAAYRTLTSNTANEDNLATNQTYINYCNKLNETQGTLNSLIYSTFITEENNEFKYINKNGEAQTATSRVDAINGVNELLKELSSIDIIKNSDFYKKHTYKYGLLGQFNKECEQISDWKKDRANLLKQINSLSLEFFNKYEPYLKEGTYSDNNYVTDNAYYFGALDVAADGAIPKVEYNISVIDLYNLPNNEELNFEIGDTTYIEDIGMFGINKKTGFPNRLKVLISEIAYNLDSPKDNSIKVQNFTTQFEDLFQQVTSSVQNLTFNENIYKRATNFTANKAIKNESLQGALDTNELTLLQTDEKNIEIDKTGQSGSDINNHNNKYKLTGEGLFFSNNGGETWNVGVGPGGINADYIQTGTLDAGKIRIVDNDYVYFLWDKGGIYAYREPTSENNDSYNDFALFNKYGLSLVKDNKIRLRAGYNFNEQGEGSTGIITNEEGLGEDIGFYLYDNNGHTIFQTQTGDDSAALALKGEIFVTDNDIAASSITTSAYKYEEPYKVIETAKTTFNLINDWQNSYLKKYNDRIEYDNGEKINTEIHNNRYLFKIQTKSLVDRTDILNYLLICLINSDKELPSDILNPLSSNNKACKIEGIEFTILNGEQSDIYIANILECELYWKDNTRLQLKIHYTFGQESNIEREELMSNNYCIQYYNNTKSFRLFSYQLGTTREIDGELSSPKSFITTKNLETMTLFFKNDSSRSITGAYDKTRKILYKTVSNTDFTPPVTGTKYNTALLLNNKKINSSKSNVSTYDRLFSAITNSNQDKDLKNLFSILKNGSLFIGGDVYDNEGKEKQKDILKVPDAIVIKNEFLRVAENSPNEGWAMYLNFEKLFDTKTGKDLISVLNDKFADIKLIKHRHAIKKLNLKIDSSSDFNKEQNFIYLPAYYDNSDQTNNLTIKEFITGLSTGKPQNGVKFDRKVAIADREYEYTGDNYTEYTGAASDSSDDTGASGNGLLKNPYI